jgi:hypothetical protein
MATTVMSRCRDGGNGFEIVFWYEMRSTEFLRVLVILNVRIGIPIC